MASLVCRTERNKESNEGTKNKQLELVRRWDSERELFYDDIVHVEASAYVHWTDFLISTITEFTFA